MLGEPSDVLLLSSLVTALGFLLLAALIIALGASSTAKYEFERNRAQTQRQQQAAGVGGAAAQSATDAAPTSGDYASGDHESAMTAYQQAMSVSVATHPAGKQRVEPDAVTAWWLVDDSSDQPGGQIVAGPFADRIDADWAALAAGLSDATRAVHGVQRGDGGVVRRQSPEENAWLSELGSQLDRLPEDWDELLTDDDALTTLVVEVAAALVEAGLPVHDCAGEDTAGGVCLTPGPHYAGVVVSWHQHERMSGRHVRGDAITATVQRTMNGTIADVLTGMGFAVESFTETGSILVTDMRG